MRKRKLLRLSLILIMMLLLLPGMHASANTGSSGKIKTAAPGTKLTESAYVVPLKDGRDTLELIDIQSAEIAALKGIVVSKDIQIDRLISAVEDLNSNRLQERTEWQEQVKVLQAALSRKRRKRWAAGPFIGLAHTGEGVVGIGITYAIILF